MVAPLIILALCASGFIAVGRWAAADPERLVSTHVPASMQAEQRVRIRRSSRAAQVLGVALLVAACAAVVLTLTA